MAPRSLLSVVLRVTRSKVLVCHDAFRGLFSKLGILAILDLGGIKLPEVELEEGSEGEFVLVSPFYVVACLI